LCNGRIGNNQLIANQVFDLIVQLRKETEDSQRIFGWYCTNNWYYASGAAGCHCIVVPEMNAVAVRMLNKYTDQYEDDQIKFNETHFKCLKQM
jgi:hypothetical protein